MFLKRVYKRLLQERATKMYDDYGGGGFDEEGNRIDEEGGG